MKLTEAVELYCTHCRLRGRSRPQYRNYGLRRLLKCCQRKSIESLTRLDLEMFADSVQNAQFQGRPYSSSMRSEWLNDLRHFLAWCSSQNLVLADLSGLVPRVKIRQRLPQVPSEDEVRQLLAWPPLDTPQGLRTRGLWELAYGTGLRLGELLSLDLADIDLGERWLVVREAKNGHSRLAPLGETAASAVYAWLEVRQQLWTPRAGEALWVGLTGVRLPRSCAAEEINTASRALGFRVTMHALRHAFATHLLQAGAPVRIVQELLGHVALNSTQRYTRVVVTDLRKLLRHHPRGNVGFKGNSSSG